MTLEWATAAWFLPFVTPIANWVVWSDLSSMKIPNKAVLALLAVFVLVGLVALPFNDYLWRYSHFAVLIVAGFVVSSIGLMGAGDAKFLAAMGPFIAVPDIAIFAVILGTTSLAALILHTIIRYTPFLYRLFPTWKSLEPETEKSFGKRKIPYGFGLAPSLVFYLLIGLFTG